MTFAYDALGRRTLMVDPSGRTTYTYDAAGRLTTQVAAPAKRTTYTYDATANRATMVDPDGGTTTYSYDARNGLASLVNPLQETTTWQYDAVGRIVTMTHANGSHAVHTYNAAGWVTSLVDAKSDGTTITSHDYSYDEVGNPTLMVEAPGYRFTWTYDALNQLTAERGRWFSAFSITYTYDPVGNRATKLQSEVTTTYTYDAADELTLEDAAGEFTTYSYDENGNTLLIDAAGERTTLTWSYEDEVLVIHAPEHVPVTMTYNGDHMRRRRQDANAVINYLWDGAQAFIETQSQDATLARYTLAPFGHGDLVSQRRSNETRLYHFDAIGSTRALTDDTETVTDTYAFEAFGKRIATSGSTTNPYQWIARLGYLGEGRLDGYLLRRRYYRYGAGRFVSRDPVETVLPAYPYAAGQPAAQADPSGEQSAPAAPLSERLFASPGAGHAGRTWCDMVAGKPKSWVDPSLDPCFRAIVAQHENVHYNQMADCCALAAKCNAKRLGRCGDIWDNWERQNLANIECEAYHLYTWPWMQTLSFCCKAKLWLSWGRIEAEMKKQCRASTGFPYRLT